MLRTYAVCNECEENEILYEKVQDVGFNYEHIVGEDGEPRFDEYKGWVIKGRQDPADPLVVEFEYYCPECASYDEVEDSGDRMSAGV